MKKMNVLVCLLGLTAGQSALANTPEENVALSARPVAVKNPALECGAYTGRPVVSSASAADPLERTLKVMGTVAAAAALSTVAHYGGSAPEPRRTGRFLPLHPPPSSGKHNA